MKRVAELEQALGNIGVVHLLKRFVQYIYYKHKS